jgi:hypothetical protein
MTHKKVDDSQATLVRAEHEQVEELRAEVKAQALSIARLRQIVQELVTAANVLTIRPDGWAQLYPAGYVNAAYLAEAKK